MSQFIEAFIKKWSLYLLETTLLLVIVVPIHYVYEVALISYFLIAVIATVLYQSLVRWKDSVYMSVLALLIVGVLGYFLGYPAFIAILLSMVFFWRNTNLYMKKPSDEGTNLMVTLLFGLPYYLFFGESAIVWFVVLQLILIAIVKVLSISFLTYTNSEHRRKYVQTSFLILLGCFGLSLVLVVIYPYVLRVLYSGYLVLITITAWLASPLFYLVEWLEIDMDRTPEDQSATEFEESNEEDPLPFDHVEAGGQEYHGIIYWVIGIVVLAFLLLYIFKNIKQKKLESDTSYKLESMLEKPRKTKTMTRDPKYDDKLLNNVRKSFFSLQRNLAKYDYYRDLSVTVEDWFSGLPLNKENKNTVMVTYQSVRYGYQQPTKEEMNAYDLAIKALKKEAKEKNKMPGDLKE